MPRRGWTVWRHGASARRAFVRDVVETGVQTRRKEYKVQDREKEVLIRAIMDALNLLSVRKLRAVYAFVLGLGK